VSGNVQLVMLLVVLVTALVVLRLVRRRRLQGKYVLIWLAACIGMVPVAVVPDRIDSLLSDLGVSYPPAAYLLVAVLFLFGVVVQMSRELSRLADQARSLAEELALLRGDMEHPARDA